jgi:hypothetical protein
VTAQGVVADDRAVSSSVAILEEPRPGGFQWEQLLEVRKVVKPRSERRGLTALALWDAACDVGRVERPPTKAVAMAGTATKLHVLDCGSMSCDLTWLLLKPGPSIRPGAERDKPGVTLIEAPGHTPGTMALRVDLADEGTMLFTAWPCR